MLTWSRDTGLLFLVAARLSNMLMDNSAVSALSLVNLRGAALLYLNLKRGSSKVDVFALSGSSPTENPLSRSQHRNDGELQGCGK